MAEEMVEPAQRGVKLVGQSTMWSARVAAVAIGVSRLKPYNRREHRVRHVEGGWMIRIGAAKCFAIPTLALVAFLALVWSGSARTAEPVPWTAPVDKAKCGVAERTEGGLQGETTRQERLSGDSENGYNCNLELVGQYRGEGTKSQGALAWSDHCAYYTTINNPLQEHRGTVVLDVSDPAHPRVSTYLDAPAMLDPHE